MSFDVHSEKPTKWLIIQCMYFSYNILKLLLEFENRS